MEIYINDKTFLIIISPKSIRFDLPIEVSKNLRHEIKFILSCNDSFAGYTIKKQY